VSGRLISISVALGCVLATAAAGPSGDGPSAALSLAGNYYSLPDSQAVVALADCGERRLCGRLVGLGKLTDQGTAQKKAQPRHLCGVTVVTDLRPTDQGGWEGRFRDPNSGNDYWLVLYRQTTAANANLAAQRYRSRPLFSRALPAFESWERVAAPTAPCAAVTPTSLSSPLDRSRAGCRRGCAAGR
jgi:hypothetical protein